MGLLKLKYKNNQTELENELKEFNNFYKKSNINIQENIIITRRCDIFITDVHRSSYAKYL